VLLLDAETKALLDALCVPLQAQLPFTQVRRKQGLFSVVIVVVVVIVLHQLVRTKIVPTSLPNSSFALATPSPLVLLPQLRLQLLCHQGPVTCARIKPGAAPSTNRSKRIIQVLRRRIDRSVPRQRGELHL
jgi:hypothetical protein